MMGDWLWGHGEILSTIKSDMVQSPISTESWLAWARPGEFGEVDRATLWFIWQCDKQYLATEQANITGITILMRQQMCWTSFFADLITEATSLLASLFHKDKSNYC